MRLQNQFFTRKLASSRNLEWPARRPFQPWRGAVDRSPGCSAAKPWVNSQGMGSALKGRGSVGGIPVRPRVSAAPPGLGSILLDPRVPLCGFRRSAAPWATIHRPSGTDTLTHSVFSSFATETRLDTGFPQLVGNLVFAATQIQRRRAIYVAGRLR